MDSLSRLTRAWPAFICALCLWIGAAGSANAYGNLATAPSYGWYQNGSFTGAADADSTAAIARAVEDWRLAKIAAGGYVAGCYTFTADQITALGGTPPTQYSFRIYNNGGCGLGASGRYVYKYYTVANYCPVNSTAGGGYCTCNSGWMPNAGGTACDSVSTSCATIVAAANSLSQVFTTQASPGTLSFCNAGCQISGGGATFWKDAAGVYQAELYGPFTLVNSTCGTPTTPPVSSAPAPCPTGQYQGTVNGSTVCVPATASTTAASSAASSPSGSASAPSMTVSDGSGGSIGVPAGGSSTTATTCIGKICTNTVTVKDATGATVGQVSSTEDKQTFCQENPDTTICKSSTFSSACASGTATPVCDGDAVQCAIAKEQYKRACQFFNFTAGLEATGDAAVARGDTRASDHPKAPANVTSTSMASAVDQTDLTPGSCPADQTVAVGSGSVVMPWSQVCTPATWLGNLLVSLTALAWVFIAFKTG